MHTEISTTDSAIPVNTREMLEKSLAQPHPVVRLKAIEAACRLNSPAIVPLIVPLLTDPDPRVRTAAVEAFGRYASAGHIGIISSFSQAADAAARAVFVSALRSRDSADALWTAILTGTCPADLRVGAIEALGNTTVSESMQAIIEAVVDEDLEVRTAAEQLLQQHPAWLATAAATQALGKIDAARTSGTSAAHAAVAWCERIRGAQLRKTMVESGVASTMALTTALRSRSAVLRQGAAETCAALREERTIPALTQLIHDSDPLVRRAAAVALSELGWRPDTAEQFAALLVAVHRFKAACEVGSQGVDAVLAVLAGLPAPEQIAAADSLASAQSIRAMPALASLLDSPDIGVRRAAANALKRLEWVPTSAGQAIRAAMALEDWPAVAAQGAPAINPLFNELKSARADAGRSAAVSAALLIINDPLAVEALLPWCSDGEVAAIAVAALDQALSQCAAFAPLETLHAAAQLEDAVQFNFVFDPTYGQHVRAGLDVVSTASIRDKAAQALAARQATNPAPETHA